MHEEIFSVRFFFAQEPEFGLAGFIIPMVFTGGAEVVRFCRQFYGEGGGLMILSRRREVKKCLLCIAQNSLFG